MKTRMEHDSMGEIAVEEDKYWEPRHSAAMRISKSGMRKSL